VQSQSVNSSQTYAFFSKTVSGSAKLYQKFLLYKRVQILYNPIYEKLCACKKRRLSSVYFTYLLHEIRNENSQHFYLLNKFHGHISTSVSELQQY